VFWWIVPFLWFPQPALFSQSLHLSPASGPRGETVAIEISLESNGGKEPTALQWDTTIPQPLLTFPKEVASVGQAAQAAGKSVSCAIKTKTGVVQTAVCILYGGQEVIRNGVVAVLQLRVDPKAKPRRCRLTVDHGLAVYKDLTQVSLDAAETSVNVRR
jgi:hypothetical protein